MSATRSEQWKGRFRLLRDIETARVGAADYDGADRALHLRRAAQQRWAREVMLPLVPA